MGYVVCTGNLAVAWDVWVFPDNLVSCRWMQSSAQDAAFTLSAGGLLFPRAIFGAGAFWNYRDDVATDSAEMMRRTDALAARMKERGVMGLCQPGCSCSFGSRCGAGYKPNASAI